MIMKRSSFAFSTIYDVTGDDKGVRYTPRTAQAAARYGFGLELAEYCISDNCDDDSAVRGHFERNLSAAPVIALHAPFNELFPHAIDRKAVELAEMRYDAAYRLCESNSIPKMVVHANYIETLYHPDWFITRQTAFWTDFIASHPGKTIICLENVFEPEPRLIRDIIERVGSSRLRMCLDTGHANLSEVEPMKWLDYCADVISHFHLHNNYGAVSSGWRCVNDTHSAPQNGSIDFRLLMAKAAVLNPEATFTFECADFDSCAVWLEKEGFLNAHQYPTTR